MEESARIMLMPYKVAIVGCGLIGDVIKIIPFQPMLALLYLAKIYFTSVVDTNDSNLTDFCSQYPCQSFHDLEDCLKLLLQILSLSVRLMKLILK